MSGVAKEKIFLLGVGAQKAGTTWLYDYLSKHESVDLGFRKEYHVFDALAGNGFFELRVRRGRKQLEELEERLRRGNTFLTPGERLYTDTFKLIDFLYDYNNYFEYFSNLYIDGKITLTGDITPSYSGLPKEIFQAIKDGFASRGITVKSVFLMRDPVERFISACQMQAGQSRREVSQSDFDKIASTQYKSLDSRDRGRYDITIKNLESVFESTELHYDFYERLFNVNSIDKICEFLRIERIDARFDEKINESKRKFFVDDDIKKKVRCHFSPVYEFLYEKYSREFIDGIWKSYV